MSLRATEDGFSLYATIHHQTCSVKVLQEHQIAQKSPRENIIRQLTKLGDTIYTCSEVEIPSDFNYFIPNSVLSEMRRLLVEELCQLKLTQGSGSIPLRGRNESSPPVYTYPYLYNISNHLSQKFYNTKGLTAYELKGGDGPVMQCRHCIRYSLGYCVRRGGKQPEWKEPLFLQLGDGRRFHLEFDCKNCQMNVYA